MSTRKNCLLSLSTLGLLQIRVNGRDVRIQSRHAQRLLIFLCAQPGHHPRRELASMLFGTHDTARALTYLRQALQRLRQARPAIGLEVDAQQIGLSPTQAVDLDLTRLLCAAQDDAQAREAAIADYHGAFLEAETSADAPVLWWEWVHRQRSRAEQALQVCYARHTEALLEAGERQQAWALLETWMQAFAMHDVPHQEAMRFLLSEGRMPEALQLYAHYAERLASVSGRRPGDTLQALYARLREQLQATTAPATSSAQDQAQYRFVTLLAMAPDRGDDGVKDEAIEAHFQRFLPLVRQLGERYGGQFRIGSDGVLELHFDALETPEIQADQALRAALELRRLSPAPSPRLGIHCALTLHSQAFGPVGTLTRAAHACAWANDARGGVVLSETVVKRAGLVGAHKARLIPLAPIDVSGQPLNAYWFAPTEAAPHAPTQTPLFIGRAEECACIERLAAQVLACGRGQAAWLLGPAGIGKTMLLRHLLHQPVIRQGAAVVHLRCQAALCHSPLRPIAAVLREALGLQRMTPAAAVEAVRSLLREVGETDQWMHALWLQWLDLQTPQQPVTIQFGDYRKALNDSVLSVMRARLFPHPTIFLAEDLHWADAATLELLAAFMQELNELPVLFLASSRHELALFGEQAAPHAQILRLKPWGASEARDFIRARCGQTLSPAQERAIIARADGYPLYVDALVRTALDSNAALPIETSEILRRQIDPVVHCLDLLQAAAVADMPVDIAMLHRLLSERDRATLERLSVELEAAGLWRREEAGWLFRHELIRDAVYASTPKYLRTKLHLAVADSLETTDGSDPALLAQQYAAGQAWAAAAGHALTAAQHELRLGQYGFALEHYRRAAHWLRASASAPELAQALAGVYLAQAMNRGYSAEPTLAALDALEAALARQDDTSPQHLAALYGRWAAAGGRQPTLQGMRLGRQIAALRIDGLPAGLTACVADYTRGWSLFWRGDLRASRRHLGKAIARWQANWSAALLQIPSDFHVIKAIAYYGVIEAISGDYIKGFARCQHALCAIDARHQPSLYFFLRTIQMNMALWSRDAEMSLWIADEILRLCARSKLQPWHTFAQATRAWALVELGRCTPLHGLHRIGVAQRAMRAVWGFGADYIAILQIEVVRRAGLAPRALTFRTYQSIRDHGNEVLLPSLIATSATSTAARAALARRLHQAVPRNAIRSRCAVRLTSRAATEQPRRESAADRSRPR
ncbi:AAA family ATPase [Acidihalobacter ferrooxydans]|uniref:Bacterial transcriptional activator domain-containing protein n=1 Tax=Acidihalobacter ferrooxydans TaxID=1765967 RepID=A0A1P8UGA4_9GAMM|nr:AAA family ATPase [Acidihalobacter ferrooxydans]APZ42794.1 hypothetical protein BW247_06560 [Acidihalobacter ferrooxydans]